MNSATLALFVLVASGAVGVLGLWQLLAGTSRSAELAARGQATPALSTQLESADSSRRVRLSRSATRLREPSMESTRTVPVESQVA